MGIRGLNSLKAWDQPSDYGYDTTPDNPDPDEGEDSPWRFADLEEVVTYDADQDTTYSLLAPGLCYAEDSEGAIFFVQLRDHLDEEVVHASNSDDDGLSTGFIGRVVSNDESQISLEAAPIDANVFFVVYHLAETADLIDTYLGYGLQLEVVSGYAMKCAVGDSSHFVTP